MNITKKDLQGNFCYSLAGHDKGKTYIILRMEDDIAYLADGILKTVDNPKKKKLKHLQIVNTKCETILKNHDSVNITDLEVMTDVQVKRAIKLFIGKGKEED